MDLNKNQVALSMKLEAATEKSEASQSRPQQRPQQRAQHSGGGHQKKPHEGQQQKPQHKQPQKPMQPKNPFNNPFAALQGITKK